ncbi:uncharacterized protein LOC122573003 [Bombus pyrosoma]|uniref:uncharacterized protein LOC122573003 n=1 Tax=Bombus pyrosoma TaxID=396416 RepID=UPI001CB8C5AF|nr:uncharacterized protein LOC122573003 [Bombus pyrosoma]
MYIVVVQKYTNNTPVFVQILVYVNSVQSEIDCRMFRVTVFTMGKAGEIYRGENCQTVLVDVETRNRVNYLQSKTKKKDEIRRRMLKSRGAARLQSASINKLFLFQPGISRNRVPEIHPYVHM